MIRSKIHRNWYLWLILMVTFIVFGFIVYILKSVFLLFKTGILFPDILIIIFFIFLELFLVIVIKDFKYIIIDKQKNNLRYYSVLRPFGVMLELDYFDSKIKTSETSIRGQYDVVYLVKDGYTMFKISGLFYENFKEIDSCIKLKRIYSYKFNFKLYLKLLFTGKIKIEE